MGGDSTLLFFPGLGCVSWWAYMSKPFLNGMRINRFRLVFSFHSYRSGGSFCFTLLPTVFLLKSLDFFYPPPPKKKRSFFFHLCFPTGLDGGPKLCIFSSVPKKDLPFRRAPSWKRMCDWLLPCASQVWWPWFLWFGSFERALGAKRRAVLFQTTEKWGNNYVVWDFQKGVFYYVPWLGFLENWYGKM